MASTTDLIDGSPIPDTHRSTTTTTTPTVTSIGSTPNQQGPAPYYPPSAPLLSSVQNIPQLKGPETFAKWLRECTGLLVSHKRFYIVATVSVPHTSTSSRRGGTALVSAPPRANMEDDNADVWGFLLRSLDDSVISRLTQDALDPTLMDTKKLWKEIHQQFDRTDVRTAGRFVKKLFTMELEEGGNAQGHLNKMRRIYTKLTTAGEQPSDRLFAIAMLNSLPHEYNTVASNKYSETDIESRDVQNAIFMEWERLGHPGRESADSDDDVVTDKTKKDDAKAFFADPKYKERQFNKPKKLCKHHPGSNSHDTSECRSPNGSKVEDLAKKIKDLEDRLAVKAAIAHTVLLEGDGDGAGGWVAVAPTGMVGECIDDTEYLIDSGASEHMVCTDAHLHNKIPVGYKPIKVGGNHRIMATHQGTLLFDHLELNNVLLAPDLAYNLISVRKLTEAGHRVIFNDDRCSILDKSGKSILEIRSNGLYPLKASITPISLVAHKLSSDALLYIHRSLGHTNWADVVKLAKSGKLGTEWTGMVYEKWMDLLCESCIKGKAHRLASPPSDIRAVKPNEIVHVDLWGPTNTASNGGCHYFLTCYDDYSHRIQLYFLKSKKDTLSAFKNYLKLVENQCDTTVKMIRSDNGGEFTSLSFMNLLASEGIIANPVPPAAHAQNGRVERVHLTLLNIVRTILEDTQYPKYFWAEMAGYAAYVRNRIPKKGTMLFPQELWTGRTCTQTQLRPFGTEVFVREHKATDKLDPRGKKVMLVGYQSYSEGTIRYYDPSTKTYNFSRDYKFGHKLFDLKGSKTSPQKTHTMVLPSPFPLSVADTPTSPAAPFPPAPSSTAEEITPNSDSPNQETRVEEDAAEDEGDVYLDAEDDGDVEPALPQRPPTPTTKVIGGEWIGTNQKRGTSLFRPGKPSRFDADGRRIQPGRGKNAVEDDPEDEEILATLEAQDKLGLAYVHDSRAEYTFCLVGDVPKTFKQAQNSRDGPEWNKAVLEELAKMEQYDVWRLVLREHDMRVLKARWVFTRKVDGDTGKVAAYKARWVAKGYTQIEGLDFNEIFSSVAHKDTIRVFLAYVNHFKLHCDQVDIKAAFLNGELEETIYLEAPEGSDIPPNQVLKLNKSLYGLKQSPRCFNDKLDAWLKEQGFQQAAADSCLYTHFDGDDKLLITMHVDDQLIAGNNREKLDQFKQTLNAAFECTDHGPVKYFLGFNVIRDVGARNLAISLEHYLEGVLEKFDMSACKPEKTPLPMNFEPKTATDDEFAQARDSPYPAIVGSVMYAASVARPDLAFAANLLARYITKWSEEHYRAAKHLLRYIRGTTDFCLAFAGSSSGSILYGLVDADWGGCSDTRRSTTGYLTYAFDSLIGWRSKRQPTVALSTMEAELMAGCDVTKQMRWLQMLLTDLRVPMDGPATIWCDNQGTIQASANPGQHDKRKHIDIRANYVLENVRGGAVAFRYVPTDDNTADMLTKSLNKIKVAKLTDEMGLRRMHLTTRD